MSRNRFFHFFAPISLFSGRKNSIIIFGTIAFFSMLAAIILVMDTNSSGSKPGEPYQGGICAENGGCDGTNDLIAAPCDEGMSDEDGDGDCTGSRGAVPWNEGQNKNTPADSPSNGYANTRDLIGRGTDNDGDDYGPHPAANRCWTKSVNGYSDWYLPAKHELDELYSLLVYGYWYSPEQNDLDQIFFTILHVITHGAKSSKSSELTLKNDAKKPDDYYWSSAEYQDSLGKTGSRAWNRLEINGGINEGGGMKPKQHYVRCVRRSN